jgi:hypothetical protein
MFAHPRFGLVTDPTRFAGEDEAQITFKWNQHINVAMNDFESGEVTDRTFEAGVLVAADKEGVEIFASHRFAYVSIPPLDFSRTDQEFSPVFNF